MWHVNQLKQGLAEVGIIGRLAFLVVVAFFAIHLLIFIGFIILMFVAGTEKSQLLGVWLIAHIVWELIGGVVLWTFLGARRLLRFILYGE